MTLGLESHAGEVDDTDELLGPGEVEQSKQQPYVADWMVREGVAAMRRRVVDRRQRRIIAIAVLLLAVCAWATLA